MLSNGHAELAPKLPEKAECWYLPIFGVYHPKKPDKIRVVFDSSSKCGGVSLNSVLLLSPNLNNSLLGVLMRFRRDLVAISADIEQMFYCFSVAMCHRDFLRFIWYKDNDPSKPLTDYRMTRHVFGNKPSPAVATYGLRKAVESADPDVKNFVNLDFYVDDGLTSCPSSSKAIDLLQRTRDCLAVTGLNLHKIASNDPDVMRSLPKKNLAADLSRVDLEHESLPAQRSLGVEWDLNRDSFTFVSKTQDRPVTKRGLLSAIHSIFDSLGILAPVVINGRLILRDVMLQKLDWDEPLQPDISIKWESWQKGLVHLHMVQIPRCFFRISLDKLYNFELHTFSDAREKAVAAVSFLVAQSTGGVRHVSFIMGKSKVAPSSGHTIPRLELCAAVLATEVYQIVVDNLRIDISCSNFYTDSRVVLGYIWNQSRRFYTYVSNRVQKIRLVPTPQQWQYVATGLNPADVGTRGVCPSLLQASAWLSGPQFLCDSKRLGSEFFHLLDPDQDKEIRSRVAVKRTVVMEGQGPISSLGCQRFSRFSDWSRLVLAFCVLRHIAVSFHQKELCKGWHVCNQAKDVEIKQQVEFLILKEVQRKVYMEEVTCLLEGRPLAKSSCILRLDPFLDSEGMLRIGRRLCNSSLPNKEKHPLLLPGKHHVSKLLVQYIHESVKHQGRLLTEGAMRSARYWVTGAKRIVSTLVHNCVTCRKFRGRFEFQKMSDLPADRVEEANPFSFVGVDVFGPWQIVSRRTRGGQANSKRWAVLFTCLTIRAVHIEVIEEMTSSAFINPLRRFISIRGKVKQFRSDRGTNFVGAIDKLGVNAINVEDPQIKHFLFDSETVWFFNPPHSSHMGGVWERMIGISRRILDSMLLKTLNLTHDVLVTLMAEVSAIINARPIVPVSADPECPDILSPSALLTMKIKTSHTAVECESVKNLYKDQWRRVQFLAEQFWTRWRRDYLQSLQSRWLNEEIPLKVNDVVLLKDSQAPRNSWPMARISRIFPSSDDRIRKVEISFLKDGKKVFLTRPVVELVLLVRK